MPHLLLWMTVGSGHHTLGPQKGNARLLPAIQSLCDEFSFKYQEVVDRNGYAGGLKIRISS